MAATDGGQSRVLESHFTCGSGLLIESECLGRSYSTKTTGRDLSVSLPQMPADWQGNGFLDPPALAANGTQPPDEWLFIRDARSLVNAKQYLRAVIDSGTAAELAFTALIDRQFALNCTSQQDRDQKFNNHKGLYRLSQLLVNENAGTAPDRLNEELGRPRNQAAHRGYVPSLAETEAAVAKATEIVEQAYPLASL